MHHLLKKELDTHQLIQNSDKIGIAVSGGRDSVLCAHLFDRLQIPFVILHCNFQLRGEQSDLDEAFVKDLGAKLKSCNHVYTKRYNTIDEAEKQGDSIQSVARKLRYQFFKELYDSTLISKLVTAHHQQDEIETFFINLYRTTGLRGLKAIPIKRDYIIRPMLSFSNKSISYEVAKSKMEYREDVSNKSRKYLRNKIRLDVLPKLEEVLPDFQNRAASTIENLKEEFEVFKYLTNQAANTIAKTKENGEIHIDLQKASSYPQSHVILYRILDDCGFNMDQCRGIMQFDSSNNGSQFTTSTHDAVLHQNQLLVKVKKAVFNTKCTIYGPGHYEFAGRVIQIEIASDVKFSKDVNEEFVQFATELFPFELRSWEEGDFIQPLGMKGHKLLSDLFIDLKINRFKKQDIPLLCKGKEVFWVAGIRISEKLKVKSSEDTIYRLKLI